MACGVSRMAFGKTECWSNRSVFWPPGSASQEWGYLIEPIPSLLPRRLQRAAKEDLQEWDCYY